MRIKKLDILGFKSFADRMTLYFDSNITGVVGPNGCGKSNVVDALRWVMGEQNAKHLRGDHMQDIIFGGSKTRGPLGLSEVTLTLENTAQSDPNGLDPLEYSHFQEIQITRRLYRTGDSEYEINKRPCRLKDITDLFLGTGVGTKAYSIIEQGRVTAMISAKPEERRYFIEEAAGITKYKSKRMAAFKKMELTRQNLLRISDILKEVSTQLHHLQKQAQKTKQHQELTAKLKSIEIHYLVLKGLEYYNESRYLGEQKSNQEEQNQAYEQQLEGLEAIYAQAKEQAQIEENQVRLKQALLYETEQALALNKQEIQFSEQTLLTRKQQSQQASHTRLLLQGKKEEQHKQKVSLKTELETAQSALLESESRLRTASDAFYEKQTAQKAFLRVTKELQTTVQDLALKASRLQHQLQLKEQHIYTHKDRIERIHQQTLELQKQEQALKAQLQTSKEEFLACQQLQETLKSAEADQKSQEETQKTLCQKQEEHHQQLFKTLTQNKSRLQSLEEVDARLEWSDEGLAQALKQLSKEDMLGFVADCMDVSKELEAHLESWLEERLESLIVKDRQAGLMLAEHMKDHKLGNIKWYCSKDTDKSFKETSLDKAKPLLSYITLLKHPSLIQTILKDVWVCEDLEQALNLWPQAQEKGMSLGVLSGEFLLPHGAFLGGIKATQGGLLKRKKEIRLLKEHTQKEEEALSTSENQLLKSKELWKNLQTQLHQVAAELSQTKMNYVRQESKVISLERNENDLLKQIQALGAEKDKLLSQIQTYQNEQAPYQTQWATTLKEHEEAQKQMDLRFQEQGKLDQELETENEQVTRLRIECASFKERVFRVENQLKQTEQHLVDLDHQTLELEQQIQNFSEDVIRFTKRKEGITEKIQQIQAEKETISIELHTIKEALAQKYSALKEQELLINQLRKEKQTIQNHLHDLALKQQQSILQLEHIQNKMKEAYEIYFEEVVFDYHLHKVEAEAEKQIANLKRAIDQLGSIYPNAVEEYESLLKRFEFLKNQSDDLEKAIKQLEEAIVQIDDTTKERFLEVFHAVNERFGQVFPRLFRGGRAYLKLTHPDDILQTGVEIEAEPPGKKLTSIALMSGGEKALTATSLIFAIFLIKPAPFCLLDEVDAPLDEANVNRFSQMIKEMSALSQFIIITHNKRSMEIADQLYGVTMEEPGVSKLVNVRLKEQMQKTISQESLQA